MYSSKRQARRKSFLRPTKLLAASVALASMVSTSLMATELVLNENTVRALPNLQNPILKYRPAPADTAIEDSFIVVLKDEFVNQQSSLMAAQSGQVMTAMELKRQAVISASDEMAGTYGASVSRRYHATISGFVTKMSKIAMKNMLADERIAFIEQDQMMYASDVQFNATWGLDRIDQADLPLNGTYNYDVEGSGVKAFILDTGILGSHSDFSGRVVSGFTAINDGNGTTDCNGHGTHVAGTVGSDTYGVAKNVTLIPVRVLGCSGGGTNSGVIAGVDWVAQNGSGASVANMSLGGGNSTALDNAVNSAINAGVTFVVAAGNSNANACTGSPNRVPAALTVASSTSSDSRSSFSNWGSCVDLFAPGSSITSTWDNGGTATISGTSMASPHVAGAVALYLQSNPSASPSTVESVIESAAVSNRISSVSGSPNLLVQTTFGGSPAPSPTPDPDPDPTPTPTPNPGDPEPIDAVVDDISVGFRQWVRYTLEIESGYSDLEFSISGGSGDADLYIRYGAEPSTFNYDCRPYLNGNSETCQFDNPPAGVWHIGIRGYRSSSGVTLRATAD